MLPSVSMSSIKVLIASTPGTYTAVAVVTSTAQIAAFVESATSRIGDSQPRSDTPFNSLESGSDVTNSKFTPAAALPDPTADPPSYSSVIWTCQIWPVPSTGTPGVSVPSTVAM